MLRSIFNRPRTSFSDQGSLRVAYGNPLAEQLIGAWVCGPGGGDTSGVNKVSDRIYGQDMLQDIAAGMTTGHIITAAGGAMTGGHYFDAPQARLKRSQLVSLIWHGVIRGNHTGSGATYFAGMNYGGGGSPFAAYTMYRDADETTVGFQWNSSGVFATFTVSSALSSSDWFRPLTISATWGIGSVRGYKDGREIGNGTGVSTINYNTTPRFAVCGDANADIFSADGNFATSLVLIYGRALTPTDHRLLALNPFRVFETGRTWSSGLGSAASNLAIFDHHYKQQGMR